MLKFRFLTGVVILFGSLSITNGETPGGSAEKLVFSPIFDGKSLDGWMGAVDGYEAVDGVLKCKQSRGGNLLTKKQYRDFVVRLEFKLPPGGNSGFGIHCPEKNIQKSMAYEGFESQILDDSAEKYAKLQPYQYHGSIYGIIPAKRGHLKPVGEWNTQEIHVRGHYFKVILNGTVIVDADADERSKDGTMDGKEHPGLKRYQGHIGFLGHGPGMEFRKIEVAEIKPATDSSEK